MSSSPNTGNAGKGRPKGSENKVTKDLKDAILSALETAGGEGGGEAYLVTVAQRDPKTFCQLLGKVLPMEVKGNVNGTLTVEIVRFSDKDPTAG